MKAGSGDRQDYRKVLRVVRRQAEGKKAVFSHILKQRQKQEKNPWFHDGRSESHQAVDALWISFLWKPWYVRVNPGIIH